MVSYWSEENIDPLAGGGRSFWTKEAALEFHSIIAVALARGDAINDLLPLERLDYEDRASADRKAQQRTHDLAF
jgi:hypothetical protein